ncbi:MAG TPA: hypothetical protein ENH29_03995 [Bacteroidetes bacterium]|nr:hypothetical protein [Bacteroidota bacterium]
MKTIKFIIAFFSIFLLFVQITGCQKMNEPISNQQKREYNSAYAGPFLNRIAFPIGGIGAGMICLEGTGAISHVSVRNQPEIFNEPCTFAAISVKGVKNGTKVLEGQVPAWKYFGRPGSGNGAAGSSFGLPRFEHASFLARFPFGKTTLQDDDIPLQIDITGWSPFIPGDGDNASLPVGALEYHFKNPTGAKIEAVFSYNAKNFMKMGNEGNFIKPVEKGFVLYQEGSEKEPQNLGGFAAFVDDSNTVVDHCWFRGGWWDPLTIAWKNIQEQNLRNTPPINGPAPGASLFVPFTLQPGEEKTVKLMFAWYVPRTDLRLGKDPEPAQQAKLSTQTCSVNSPFYVPWYAGKFHSIEEVVSYWRTQYHDLRTKSKIFSDTFYDTTLPPEVVEAVAANLTILKTPTVQRQVDGRLWCWEGCSDNRGCCSGSCTHVWNYAQAIPHLFPQLERTLRETEFRVSQDERGHQVFRTALPIRPQQHTFHAAADGQLGGIMKMYREWRISGNTVWLKKLWPAVKQSLDYCIRTWDPKGKGVLEEPHHNTYDIEFWGPDGMCTSFYLGALTAAIDMGEALHDDVSRYRELLQRGRKFMETNLYDGEYFYQQVKWKGLQTPDPVAAAQNSYSDYSKEAIELLQKEGPKYQYGTGCLSDGVLGFWIARMCGLGEIADPAKVTSHLLAVHKYNLKHDLTDHVNPQRPSFALGKDGGLLLCTWPKGGALTLPFVYSNEVWTGIEYQVASHLMLEGKVDEGLEIVRVCRDRYDGTARNPFNEYECGHWYARALASYGLLQGLTGVRYDAVEKTLYIDSKIGDNFKSFFAAETGFGSVGLKNGKPFVEMKMGTLDIEHVMVSGKEMAL